jgi:acyl-CoA synthetase (AMP-forming)/AMP-acid ligase II
MRHLEDLESYLPNDPLCGERTLVSMLRRRAERTPDQVAVECDAGDVTYRKLWNDSERLAGALQSAGVGEGSRVVILSPNTTSFFCAFYGAQRVRATAVPLFHGADDERIREIAELFDARAVVTVMEPSEPLLRGLENRGIACLPIDASGRLAPTEEPGASVPAMLQCTSGTTGEFKGVVLTHGNLMANIRQMITRAKFNPDDTFVSWLPVYHDMGLMMTMIPFYLGARLVMLPISMNTRRWLKAITEHRGTVTAGPDFAYRYALRLTSDPSQYDLSSLRSAVIAAEPVRAQTVLEFERTFGLESVVKPAYGLAEATSAVTFWDGDGPVVVDSGGHVCVGAPLADVAVDIREGGRICVSGPNVSAAYYGHDSHGSWLDTGDIGYLDARGRLFVIGREKHLIIRAGRNFSPLEIERYAGMVKGVLDVAAVGIDVGSFEGEDTHVVCEISKRITREEEFEILRGVIRKVHAGLGTTPRVWLARSRIIPRTYNGKVQYSRLRQMVIDGTLESMNPAGVQSGTEATNRGLS